MAVVLLDGDHFRAAVADPHTGHDPKGRLANAMRICRFSKMLADQGLIVVVATMSLFAEIHAWNRENQPDYFEVYLKASLETLRKRDPRSIYSREEANVVGIHLEFQEPEQPDLVLENNEALDSVIPLAGAILDAVRQQKPQQTLPMYRSASCDDSMRLGGSL